MTIQDIKTIPCRICTDSTPMLSTELCDRCWELERRVEADPELTRKILASKEHPPVFDLYSGELPDEDAFPKYGCECSLEHAALHLEESRKDDEIKDYDQAVHNLGLVVHILTRLYITDSTTQK